METPHHVAIILDGNGRWAKKHGRPRIWGHRQGVRQISIIIEEAKRLGIRHLSLFCFSRENWNRPKEEVKFLMRLLRANLYRMRQTVRRKDFQGPRFSWIGSREGLETKLLESISDLVETSHRRAPADAMEVVLAFNYSSRDELLRTVQKLLLNHQNGGIKTENLQSWSDFSKYLDSGSRPDVDLLIRTSGEQRLSNFLLLQSAYAELYFTPVYWPDFGANELQTALDSFQLRDRRYGKIKLD